MAMFVGLGMKMNKLNRLVPMIRTDDVKGTIEFYTGILGFTCNAQSEEWGWASIAQGDVEMMIAVPNKHEEWSGPIMTGSFYFYPDDIDSLWVELKDKCKICYEIENFDYGMREFAIYDNNGYLLQFGKPI